MLNIDELIKDSLKNQKFKELKVYRVLKSLITEFKTQKNAPEYTEVAEISIIRKYINHSQEALKEYLEAGRDALASECRLELEVLEKLLPASVDPQDVRSILAGWCARNGFVNSKNEPKPEIPKKSMGMAIKAMKEVFPGAEGKMVSDIVREYVV